LFFETKKEVVLEGFENTKNIDLCSNILIQRYNCINPLQTAQGLKALGYLKKKVSHFIFA